MTKQALGKRKGPKPKAPDETIAMIRSIYNQDRRERKAAGYSKGTYGLTRRIAEHFGLPVSYVHDVLGYRKRANVQANRLMEKNTGDPEKVARIREYRRQRGWVKEAQSKPGEPR